MSRNLKHATALSILLLAAAMLTALGANIIVSAQADVATVIVVATDGGTTIPAPGTYPYTNDTSIVLEAVPASGYAFHYWAITGEATPGHTEPRTIIIIDPETGENIQNITIPASPTAIDSLVVTQPIINATCGYGYTFEYTAVFTPIDATHTPSPSPTPTTTSAIVTVLTSPGGSVTPAPGTYQYNQDQNITLTATPETGYAFHYWVASGNFTQGHTEPSVTYFTDPETGEIIGGFPRPQITGIDSLVIQDNPVNITCGYGYSFEYTAIFTPVSATPTPTVTESPTVAPTTPAATTAAPTASPAPAEMTTTYIIVAVVVVIIIIVALAAVMMRRKK